MFISVCVAGLQSYRSKCTDGDVLMFTFCTVLAEHICMLCFYYELAAAPKIEQGQYSRPLSLSLSLFLASLACLIPIHIYESAASHLLEAVEIRSPCLE